MTSGPTNAAEPAMQPVGDLAVAAGPAAAAAAALPACPMASPTPLDYRGK
jgi:hypothetical protein